MQKRLLFLFGLVLLLGFSRCTKDDAGIQVPKSQQEQILEFLEAQSHDTTQLSAYDRNFFTQLRILANDVDGYYAGVDESMSLQECYNRLRANMLSRVATVTQMAIAHYGGHPQYVVLAKNAFVLMSYDALERKYPNFMWTKLGVFAANDVRAGLVLADLVHHVLVKKRIHIVIDPATGQEMTDVLLESTEVLVQGQINVLTDIGSLALLNIYGAERLSHESWLSPEAQEGYRIQALAEAAKQRGDIAAYQDLQTEAAVQFGAHEQIYILQPLWDDPIMAQMAKINQWLIGISNGGFVFFGEIFLGVNKYTEANKGYMIHLPSTAHNLANAEQRVAIARHGFETLNTLRKTPSWSYWIDFSQIRIGYFIDVYYPKGL